MIRKRVGDEFWLVAQPDHAKLCAALVAAWGNRQFARPTSPAVVRAVELHAAGWADHDNAPTLDPAGLPAELFRVPRSVEHAAWLASAQAATAADLYAGLLVSLHALSLSAIAAGQAPPDRFDDEQRRRQFDLNKIQHALIEHAEHLRGRLGLPTDRPLRLGLADGWSTPAEESLRFDLRLLQSCVALGLMACCDTVPAWLTAQPQPRPTAGPVTLAAVPEGGGRMRVRPWPFATGEVRATVPYRAVQALTFGDVESLRAAYAGAAAREMIVTLRAG